MTIVISIVSQKGGVGKSTMARMLARELAIGGMRVKIGDLDTQQQTCSYWAGKRAEMNIAPEIQVQTYASVKSAISDTPLFDALILDGKPNASEQSLDMGKVADLVLIPTGQTLDDLRPGVLLAHALTKRSIPTSKVVFALSKTTGSAREAEAARDYLKWAGYDCLTCELPISTAYGSAADQGKAITETPYLSLNTKASRLAQEILDFLAATRSGRAA